MRKLPCRRIPSAAGVEGETHRIYHLAVPSRRNGNYFSAGSPQFRGQLPDKRIVYKRPGASGTELVPQCAAMSAPASTIPNLNQTHFHVSEWKIQSLRQSATPHLLVS